MFDIINEMHVVQPGLSIASRVKPDIYVPMKSLTYTRTDTRPQVRSTGTGRVYWLPAATCKILIAKLLDNSVTVLCDFFFLRMNNARTSLRAKRFIPIKNC